MARIKFLPDQLLLSISINDEFRDISYHNIHVATLTTEAALRTVQELIEDGYTHYCYGPVLKAIDIFLYQETLEERINRIYLQEGWSGKPNESIMMCVKGKVDNGSNNRDIADAIDKCFDDYHAALDAASVS